MPRNGSEKLYRPKKEYPYDVRGNAELAGMTRNALGVARIHRKIDPKDLKSVVSYLVRRMIDRRLTGDLFAPAARAGKRR